MFARFMSNFRKPRGFVGRLVVGMMNKGHAPMTRAVVERLDIAPEDVVLDIGCGGGEAVRLMAAKAGLVIGIDISDVSVRKSLAVNRLAVESGRVSISLSSVLDMPFPRESFTLATAFETVYFWEDIQECFSRVYSALKPGGRFAITVEAWKGADGGNNFPKIFSSLNPNLYSEEELRVLLTGAGFARTTLVRSDSAKWLCVVGWKE